MNSKEIRLKNLKSLIRGHGTAAKLAELVGTSAALISQIVSENPTRSCGDRLARKIEEALSLNSGWMDKEHLGLSDIPYSSTKPEQTQEQLTDKYQLLAQLAKAIDDFSDLELSELHTQLELIRRRKRALQ